MIHIRFVHFLCVECDIKWQFINKIQKSELGTKIGPKWEKLLYKTILNEPKNTIRKDLQKMDKFFSLSFHIQCGKSSPKIIAADMNISSCLNFVFFRRKNVGLFSWTANINCKIIELFLSKSWSWNNAAHMFTHTRTIKKWN